MFSGRENWYEVVLGPLLYLEPTGRKCSKHNKRNNAIVLLAINLDSIAKVQTNPLCWSKPHFTEESYG